MANPDFKFIRIEIAVAFMVAWPVLALPALILNKGNLRITAPSALLYIAILFGVIAFSLIAPLFSDSWRRAILHPEADLKVVRPPLLAIAAVPISLCLTSLAAFLARAVG